MNLPILDLSSPKRGKPPLHWIDLEKEQQLEELSKLEVEPYRAKQLDNQYFKKYNSNLDNMSDIPNRYHEKISTLFPVLLTKVKSFQCDDGKTIKTLWKLHDGTLLESVLMRYKDRTTLCISSQAGCGMACPFCATGQGGLTRNLSTAEILEQVREGAKTSLELFGEERPLSNIVFMGMGEPLANYKKVELSLKRMCSPLGFGLSSRSVTVSTVGLVPGIMKLADSGIGCTLAVSLHAPDDELRDELVPINTKWNLSEVMEATKYYAQKTGRRVSIEYALIKDINDQPERGKLLGRLIFAHLAQLGHVNVIPLNPTPGSKWDRSPKKSMSEFVKNVENQRVSCTIRDTRGQEIAAACGQLAAENK